MKKINFLRKIGFCQGCTRLLHYQGAPRRCTRPKTFSLAARPSAAASAARRRRPGRPRRQRSAAASAPGQSAAPGGRQ